MVIIQDMAISLSVFRFNDDKPLAIPTPKMEPTSACVVEIGKPNLVARSIMDAAPNSAL